MKLAGCGILVTGASQGLGLAVAEACVAEGASVCMCARSEDALRQARDLVVTRASSAQKVIAVRADVAETASVCELVERALDELPELSGVVNNAGVLGPKGLTEEVDWDAWIAALHINLLGTVQVCRQVLPHFRKQGRGKIVNLSGGGATSPRPRFTSYAASKAAVVRFTETLAEETRGAGIDVNSVAPGALNTRLLDEVLAAGPAKVGSSVFERASRQAADGGEPLTRAAALCAFLLSSASDGITGRLISAKWDPWETLPQRRAALVESDIYTLRRIVPGDRGEDWNP